MIMQNKTLNEFKSKILSNDKKSAIEEESPMSTAVQTPFETKENSPTGSNQSKMSEEKSDENNKLNEIIELLEDEDLQKAIDKTKIFLTNSNFATKQIKADKNTYNINQIKNFQDFEAIIPALYLLLNGKDFYQTLGIEEQQMNFLAYELGGVDSSYAENDSEAASDLVGAFEIVDLTY